MTRGNLTIKCYKNKWLFQISSDGYPEDIVPSLLKIIKLNVYDIYLDTIQNLIGNVALGHVGNPCYYYDIDLVEKTIKVYESKTYWVNAPDNWKELGWYCWQGSNGKMGYIDWRKGKKIDISQYIFEENL